MRLPRTWILSIHLLNGRVLPIRYGGPFGLVNALKKAAAIRKMSPLIICTLRTL